MSRVSYRRTIGIVVVAALSSIAFAGCTGTSNPNIITIGTTDKVSGLDPVATYDSGSFAVQAQVFPLLMNTPYGSSEVEPDLAASASFTSPNDYTVSLRPGVKWANGRSLTAEDVKFSFDRQLRIKDPRGPSSLLANLDSVEVSSPTTVVFHLESPNDQVFPQVLSSPAAVIVDKEVFSPDAITPNQTIVDANAFAGQYTIAAFRLNDVVSFKANPNYQGLLEPAKTPTVNVKYYADPSNLKLDIQKGGIDVASRALTVTDINDLKKNDNLKIIQQPGGEMRFFVFNLNTQPYGAATADADAKKALAVRKAVANLIDRRQIADQVYKGTYAPLESFIPVGLPGSNNVLTEEYGNGSGGPDLGKARAVLAQAGVTTPVVLNLQYTKEHYGPSSSDEYALIKNQLEQSGLFTVNLQTTEWVQYSKNYVSDSYPVFQMGWLPDYLDPDDYLTPFYPPGNFLSNHFSDETVTDLIGDQATMPDEHTRLALISQVQSRLAADLPIVPTLQGAQIGVVAKNISGAESTFDVSAKIRFAALRKEPTQ